ncbi:UvrD-helicase domain-containing protein (plasmid) [Deinococcus taeanensis]|uniref:UvrD-helicase domain-containing protein n=1 Tax=Deinococcus taeanensis TaxID=2737050 RepID=UPI001CDBD0F0|nr:UvrD-helicase domain-containing protein [Deinococcus taeanensis]UBV45528.1 UvrD-helicase domain-containing protein [Deinococcus taeanensis]
MTAPKPRLEQQEVVDHVKGQKGTVVSAGAGTGKTFTTIASVLGLLESEPHIRLDQFVLITFSRRAAADLKLKIWDAVQQKAKEVRGTPQAGKWRAYQEQMAGLYVGTIHSFCRHLLKTYGYQQGVARESEVSFSTYVLQEVFQDVLNEQMGDPVFTEIIFRSGERKDYELSQLVRDIVDFARNRGLAIADTLHRLEQLRAERLAAGGADPALDFRWAVTLLACETEQRSAATRRLQQSSDSHDLLTLTRDLLKENHGQIVSIIGQRYKYLFIDEFQDTDSVQMEIVETLYKGMERVVVVGDRKQSIYYFRGSDKDFLETAARLFGVQILPLRTSRRTSAGLILQQNALFKGMAAGDDGFPVLFADQGLQPDPERNDKPHYAGLPTMSVWDMGTAGSAPGPKRVGQLIQRLRSKDIPYGDMAVLCRSNNLCHQYERYLKEQHIPVSTKQGESWYLQPEVITIYRLLRCVLQPTDDAAFALALQTLPLQDYRDLKVEASVWQEGVDAGQGVSLPNRYEAMMATHPGRQLMTSIKALRGASLSETVPAMLTRLNDVFGIIEAFGSDQQVQLTLERLRQMARDTVTNEQALSLDSFTSLLQTRIEQELREEPVVPHEDKEQPGTKPNEVQIMTIHASKGLEFPVVILPDLQTDLIRADEKQQRSFVFQTEKHPGDEFGLDIKGAVSGAYAPSFNARSRADEEDRVAEEMRLLYVALTRAEEMVVMVGKNLHQPPVPRRSNRYSWQDEILRHRQDLQDQAVKFTPGRAR